MLLKQKPHNLLLLTAIILFSVGLLDYAESVDIYFHNTYLILPYKFLIWILALILLIIWLLYLMAKKFLISQKLMRIHIVLTTVISLFILIVPVITTYTSIGSAGAPRRYYDYEELNRFKILGNLQTYVVPAFTIVLVIQLIFLANLGAGIYKRLNAQKKQN